MSSRTLTADDRFSYTGSALAGIPWAITGCGLTATSFLFAKLLGQYAHYSALEINLYRSILVTVLLMFYVILYKKPVKTPNTKEHFIRSMWGWGGAFLQTFAVASTVPMPTIQMLSYTNPIFFVLILAIGYKQKILPRIWGGVILGFVGAAILLRPSGIDKNEDLIYLISALVSGFFTSMVHLNIQGMMKSGEPSWRIVLYYGIFSIFFSLIGLVITQQPLQGIHTTEQALWVLGLGVFIVLGQTCNTQAYSEGNPSITGVFSYSHILFASLFSVFIFHQSVDTIGMIGISIIIFGGLLTRGLKRSA
jgi:drug/metabolite transporter (DMT)-like permease